jgi:zinc protease
VILRIALCILVLFAAPARAELPVQAVTSPGGIAAWLVEARDIPFVALEIRFVGGTSLDAPETQGAVHLMTALLGEGAGERDAHAFAAAREELAASFGFSASRDSVAVSARFLTENRDAAVELLRSALLEPRFDAEAVERVRGQVLSGLRADARRPEAIAGAQLAALAWGDHPYGREGEGTEATVAALTRDDITAAHRGALARDRLFVAAVGDIDAATLGPLLDRLLGELPAQGAPRPPVATAALEGGVVVVPFPSPQSVIVFGQPGIARNDPDFLTATIVNEVLGGGRFGTRLMTELRVRRGLTYGVFSALASGEFGALVMGRVSTGNDTVAETIAVIRAEWTRMATEGLTADELERIKTWATGSFPLRFDGNARIAEILVGMQIRGLPLDYPAIRNDRVRAITLEEANRVAARLYDPARLTFVVVGEPVGLGTEGQ